MTHPCEEQRPLLIAYLKDELPPLERTRLESHLGNCRRCGSLKEQMARAFEAARGWSPSVDSDHLERLVSRLSPYIMEADRATRPRGFGPAIAAGLAFGAALVLVLAAPKMSTMFERGDEPSVADAPILAVQPTPHIKLLASANWDGRVEAIDAERSEITMHRGFAVIEFEGGQGRHLTVHAPGVDVEVVGTRFFVDVAPSGKTSVVGVKKGRVRAVTTARLDEIGAGHMRAYGADGELSVERYAPRAAAHVEDRAFEHAPAEEAPSPEETASRDRASTARDPGAHDPAAHDPTAHDPTAHDPGAHDPAAHDPAAHDPGAHDPGAHDSSAHDPGEHERPRRPATAAKRRPHRALHPPPGSAEAIELLARAEALAKEGDLDGALAVYQKISDATDPKLARYRPLARYETARILGFLRDNRAGAARILHELAEASPAGEVTTEAAFALCELDLQATPCRAAACLRKLAEAPATAREATQLIDRWGLDKLSCGPDAP